MVQLSQHIRTSIRYVVRPEAGVQAPGDTLVLGSGSCRDMAALFVEVARRFGLASRFVSGYLRVDASGPNLGATHAWAEVYLPGIGWTGFDPTSDGAVGPDHFAVAVARDPGTVPPVSGSFSGACGTTLDVGVWVMPLADASPA
jgi:transglutaminase-like putative cysteine protease